MSKRVYEPTGEELTQRRPGGPSRFDVAMAGASHVVRYGRVARPYKFMSYAAKARYQPRRYYGRFGRQVQRLRKSLDIEKKYFDTAINFTYDATGEVPATGQLVLIPQGVTESTRVGRKCTIKSIQLRLTNTYVPGADTLGCTTAFLMLVLDKQANGAAAAATDVLTSTDFRQAMINLDNSERFVILKRFDMVLQAGAGVATAFGRDQKQIEYYKKCNIPIEYSSTAGAITEIKSNNLFFLAGTDQTTDDTVGCIGTVRVRFTDL